MVLPQGWDSSLRESPATGCLFVRVVLPGRSTTLLLRSLHAFPYLLRRGHRPDDEKAVAFFDDRIHESIASDLSGGDGLKDLDLYSIFRLSGPLRPRKIGHRIGRFFQRYLIGIKGLLKRSEVALHPDALNEIGLFHRQTGEHPRVVHRKNALGVRGANRGPVFLGKRSQLRRNLVGVGKEGEKNQKK
jgi:hypothetical protein